MAACCLAARPAAAQRLRETKYEKGMVDKGQKMGEWEYYGYTPSGRQVLVQRYDHTNRKLLYFRPGAEQTYNVELSPGQWVMRLLEQPPMYIGGDAALANYTTKLNYPEGAQQRNIQGKVTVVFTVDTLGHATNHHLVQRIGGGCDEEALRVAKAVPDEWIPARLGGKAVVTEYVLPLTFRLAQP